MTLAAPTDAHDTSQAPPPANRPNILLVIPCLNEETAIVPLLAEIQSLGEDYQALVIDDGSTDGTFSVAQRLTPVARLVCNLGIGGAVQTGLKYAWTHGYDCCIQVDGDGQHPPDQIARLVAAHLQSGNNVIIGSRYLTNESFRSTWARRMGSRLIARSIEILFGTGHMTDPTSGFRLFDRRAIQIFARRYPHDFPEAISLAWAARAGLTIGEVPVQMRAREHGESSIGGLKPFAYMIRVIGYILLARLGISTISKESSQ